ncbi:CBS domain-containing protein [Haladaptatus paucihalophilus]|uniref:CBS domain-containing protein n=2 Tax=Haladaptatus paucihalophilus DX253 TaxID=797209 RepID=A0A1M6XA92_HALPU|nr:CBS domain-containing protein [Haladaptatus paucihalophilus]SHL02789.1 CBS domain-containing protein [Haladaptatus paucihalophilus DX253]
MEDVLVGRLMSTTLQTVTPETLVEEAAQKMLSNDVGSVIVIDDENHLEGILTTTDFVKIVAERQPKDETPVSAYMTADVSTASIQDSIREVSDRMVEGGFHHMPVVDETEGVIGMISTTDLTGYLSHVQTPSPSQTDSAQ